MRRGGLCSCVKPFVRWWTFCCPGRWVACTQPPGVPHNPEELAAPTPLPSEPDGQPSTRSFYSRIVTSASGYVGKPGRRNPHASSPSTAGLNLTASPAQAWDLPGAIRMRWEAQPAPATRAQRGEEAEDRQTDRQRHPQSPGEPPSMASLAPLRTRASSADPSVASRMGSGIPRPACTVLGYTASDEANGREEMECHTSPLGPREENRPRRRHSQRCSRSDWLPGPCIVGRRLCCSFPSCLSCGCLCPTGRST